MVEVDLAEDRFDVKFDPDHVTVARLLRSIRDLGYEPELVEASVLPTPHAERVDVPSLPEELRVLFAEAKAEDKPVLVEFSGPG